MEAIAAYAFKGTESDELSFEKGSLIMVTNKDDDINWYRAEYQGKDGLVPSNYIEMKSHKWFHGKISRAKTDKLLEHKPVGAFLIRTSESSPGDFSLSVKCIDSVQHFKVLRDEDGKFFIWVMKFQSLNELVDYHKESSVSRSNDIKLRELPSLSSSALDQEPLQVVAMYNFTPQEEGELEFQKGDIIVVTNHSDLHWWHGRMGSKHGLFPAAYVNLYRP